MLQNGTVVIQGREYRFCNRLSGEPEAFKSFNQLAKMTFGIQFDQVGGEHEPHVLLDGDIVCANVSVNQIYFIDRGKRKFYVQLGTVMSRDGYRRQGLSRWLMEHIVNEWKNRCDALYLFANDSVLEFYPKFGFEAQEEFEFFYDAPGIRKFTGKKLSTDNPEDKKLILEKYGEGNPFSEFYMAGNRAIFDFYADGNRKDNIYYLERENVIVFADMRQGHIHCYDVYGSTDSPLEEILKSLRRGEDEVVTLGFTPGHKEPFVCRKRVEEDTTLFVHRCGENRFGMSAGMFPELSYA